MSKCYVYIVKAGLKRVASTKIGMANDYISRIKNLQTGNHRKLTLVTVIECSSRSKARELELLLHTLLKSRSVHGEWFKIDTDIITEALNSVSNNVDLPSADELEKCLLSSDRVKVRKERQANKRLKKHLRALESTITSKNEEIKNLKSIIKKQTVN